MALVTSPTLLFPAGPFGARTISRLRECVDLRQPLLGVIPHDDTERLDDVLSEMLRVGHEHAAHEAQRLTMVAFVDLTTDATDTLLPLLDRISTLLATGYGAVFPADAVPEQRAAGLHVLCSVPPLVDSLEARRALAQLRAVQDWRAGAPHPTLARVWLIPSQTSAGVLTEDDVASCASGFALGMISSSLSQSDLMRERLAHPRPGEGLFGFASVATLDVPTTRLAHYTTLRTAHDAMAALVARLQADAPAVAAQEALPGLTPDTWLAPFRDGAQASALRDMVWRLAGGQALPERVTVSISDTPDTLRSRYRRLYAPPAPQPDAPEDSSMPALREARHALAREEIRVTGEVWAAVERLLEGELGHTHPLDRLPEVEVLLQRLQHQLEGLAGETRQRSTHGSGPADDSLSALEDATDALPDAAALRQSAASLAVALGFVVSMIALRLLTGAPAGTGALSATVVSSTASAAVSAGTTWWTPALIGLATAVASYAGLIRWWSSQALAAVAAALTQRLELVQRHDQQSSGAGAGERLRLHRVRVARAGEVAVSMALERVQTVRAAGLATRQALASALDAMGVPPQADAAHDDVAALVGPVTPLHDRLVTPRTVARWLMRGRRYTDAESWADHIVQATWPEGGLRDDVPCGDAEGVASAVSAAMGTAADRGSLFHDEAAAAEATRQLQAFGRRATQALAQGCTPKNAHGDPELGTRAGELFTIAPSEARAFLHEPLNHFVVRDQANLWAPLDNPLVLLIRTWEGYHVDAIARGSGIDTGAAP